MNCLLLLLMLQLDSVFSSLPVPVNTSINSVNFRHVLHWVPGPGTPPGTYYKIFRMDGHKPKRISTSRTTSAKLNLTNYDMYQLAVQACYNKSLSSQFSNIVSFMPFQHTKIGSPKVSLAGCGNCIQGNISLPEADGSSGIKNNDICNFYNVQFRVMWNKSGVIQVPFLTQDKSFTLNNLEKGTNYCVKVLTEISVNKHTEPSAWECTFTSVVEPNRGIIVTVTSTALLFFLFGGLTTFMFSLYYAGIFCKLKATVPRATTALKRGYMLTPERTIPDQISINPVVTKQRKHNNPTQLQPAMMIAISEDEDEDKEEGEINYMNRAADLSSGDSSCQDSGDVSGSRTQGVSVDSWSLTVEAVPDTRLEVADGGLDQGGAKAEAADVRFNSAGGQNGAHEHVTAEVEEEENEEVCNSSGNVNLFSVTLAAMPVCEDEEEEEEEQNIKDSLTDFFKLSDLRPLLPTDPEWTLSHTDAQSELDVQAAVASLSTQGVSVTGYEGRCADTFSDCLKTMQLEEEEEEFSGYIRDTHDVLLYI